MTAHDDSDDVDDTNHADDADEAAALDRIRAALAKGELDDADLDEEDLDTEFGRISLEEHGLTLNLGESHEEQPDVVTREVTEQDRAELARVEAELFARWPETRLDPTLERIELLMDLLGHPERTFKSIHVAGTNGKTSTVRMIESLLRAFHRRTGRTTSPHLQSITERIGIDGAPIHPADFVRLYQEILPFVRLVDDRSTHPMSTFEVLIALAYSAFADAPADVAVVEVGVGGTWDATNVLTSDVAVVMPVGLDHMNWLGDSLGEIAGEKAGIIKPRPETDDVLAPADNVAIVAEQDPEALRVILQRAVEVDASVARAGSEFGVVSSALAVGGQMLTLRGLGGDYKEIFLPLAGEHQARNAAVALAAVEALFGAGAGRPLDLETVRRGFAQATSPGRLERMRSTPSTFIDAAHNPHGAQTLGEALERDYDFSRLIGIIGVLGDKDAAGILRALEPYLSEVVLTQATSPRALDAYDLADTARDIFGEERVHVVENLPGAYALAVELAEDADIQSGSGIIITGSVVTAGEARAMFGKDPQ